MKVLTVHPVQQEVLIQAAGHVQKKPAVAASAAGQEVAKELSGGLVSASLMK